MTKLTIAHISDLHFGTDAHEEAWARLTADLHAQAPQLLLVTGDIVDTPQKALYERAHSQISATGLRYLVCAGNHDRHYRGNRFWGMSSGATAFDTTFAGRVASPQPMTFRIGDASVGVAGLDSSLDAKAFARGWVRRSDIEELRRAIDVAPERKAWDLLLLLIHHHPQPIPHLEGETPDSSVLDVTSLANAGTLLDAVAGLSFDVVLHGHEHAQHMAKYGCIQIGREPVNILGAGSATGARTLKPCHEDFASYNLLTLHQDGTLECEVRRSSGGSWGTEKVQVLDLPERTRAKRRIRATPEAAGQAPSYAMYLELSPERDLAVRVVKKDAWLTKPEMKAAIDNPTGRPSIGALEVTAAGRAAHRQSDVPPERDQTRGLGNAWAVQYQLPLELLHRPATVSISYNWVGGGVLTEDDLARIVADGAADSDQQAGYQAFGFNPGDEYWQRGVLSVSFPREMMPSHIDIEVRKDGQRDDHETVRGMSSLRRVGISTYLCELERPLPRREYVVRWRPRINTGCGLPGLDRRAARKLVNDIAAVLAAGGIVARVAMIVADRETTPNPRSVLASTDDAPLPDINARGDQGALGRAWWGAIAQAASSRELLGDETTAIVVPIYADFSVAVREPCAVLRAGVLTRNSDSDDLLRQVQRTVERANMSLCLDCG